jgi:LDH2 family malate/lactate/ureidoglycolate dehydrogenase
VGAYAEALARAGLIGLAVCNGAPSGHWVAPFGGKDGRISTDPIAFAWPVWGEPPVVADFSTGATAEGVIRSLANRGELAPEGFLRDATGAPTREPGVLYGEPRGAIQPFGGSLGYRATALGLLVEALTTLMNGDAIDDRSRHGTDMTLLAIAPASGFAELAHGLSGHIRASPPLDPRRPVLMPGDRERLAAATAPDRVAVDGPTWEAIEREASRRGAAAPPVLAG